MKEKILETIQGWLWREQQRGEYVEPEFSESIKEGTSVCLDGNFDIEKLADAIVEQLEQAQKADQIIERFNDSINEK